MKSAPSCRRMLLGSDQLFDSVRSHWLTPGPRKGARPELPYRPSGGGANAAGSRK